MIRLKDISRAERQIVARTNYRLWLKAATSKGSQSVEAIVYRHVKRQYSLTSCDVPALLIVTISSVSVPRNVPGRECIGMSAGILWTADFHVSRLVFHQRLSHPYNAEHDGLTLGAIARAKFGLVSCQQR
jgi:hypothetical protein